jgi:hypothetical protein
MKLSELKAILYSTRGYTQFAILYDSRTNTDITNGTIDNIVEKYGDKVVVRIEAFENQLIITV